MTHSPATTSTKSNRKQIFGFAAAAIAIFATLGWLAVSGIGENLVYYLSPAELKAKGPAVYGAVIRLGGQVKPGSLKAKPGATELHFDVTDGTATIAVHATTLPPQMFREGIGVVVEGRYSASGVFEADRLMVKHSNEYRAPQNTADGGTNDSPPPIKTLIKTLAPVENE